MKSSQTNDLMECNYTAFVHMKLNDLDEESDVCPYRYRYCYLRFLQLGDTKLSENNCNIVLSVPVISCSTKWIVNLLCSTVALVLRF